MRTYLISICILLLGVFGTKIHAETPVQSFYFDFGPNNVANRGNITPSATADGMGHFWNNVHSTQGNNVTAGAIFDNIQNDKGQVISDIKVTVNGQFTTNGLSGGGGLLSPSEDLLGDLAVATATQDYMFLDGNNVDNRPFTVSGLNKDHGYQFYIFTSRSATDTRTGRFTIEGSNSFVGENQAAGSKIGANGENQNTSKILVSDPVFPSEDGTIKITVSRVTGTYIPVNCMKMVELADAQRPEITTASNRFYLDFGATDKGENKCEITPSPDKNGNYWNNIINTSDGSKYAAKGTVYSDMTDAAGVATPLTVTLNDRFSTNGMSGGGGLLNPDATLLGDLAISTATSDYFFYEADQSDCSMTFGGLDPEKAYKFHIFASRSATDNRTGLYRFAGDNLWSGTLQAAGSNIGGSGVNQNNANILTSDYIFADADGNIKLTISRSSGTYIPINCMKIEEFENVEKPVVTNFETLTLEGTAVNGKKVILKRQKIDGLSTNVFEGVADFAAGEFTVTAVDENGKSHKLGKGDSDNKLADGGSSIAVEAYPALLTFDLYAMSYKLTAINNIRLIGSAVGSWSLSDYKEMNYDGNLLFSWNGELTGHDTSTDSGRLALYINGSWTAFKRSGVDDDYNAILSLDNGDDIPLNPGNYKMQFDLGSGVLKVENGLDGLDNNRITVFGSSVANGQGANQVENVNQGYIHLFGQHLAARHTDGLSDNPFYISNISIGGNSTVNLLNRYDDMRREFGKYVVFGVSLGNEGIHGAANQENIYNQFKTNMLKLIEMVRADGKLPVVCNNYTRGDFTEADYKYILDMDKEIGLWDVPSINLLGAIDSKTGLWANGYQNGDDVYHPNQQGHQEFAYAIVPSMFDAMQSGKELTTKRVSAEGLNLKGIELTAIPEGTMHSFSFVIIANSKESAGELVKIKLADDKTLTLAWKEGKISATVDNQSVAVDGTPVKNTLVALNYTYASGVLDLIAYEDATLLGSNSIKGIKIEPVEFKLGNTDLTITEAMLYRSALSSVDVKSLADGELQKGSLEIYSTFYPVNDKEDLSAVTNHAMSLNSFVAKVDETNGIENVMIDGDNEDARYYTIEGIEVVNPAKGNLYIKRSGSTVTKILF